MDAVRVEAGALEMPVDVGGEDEVAILHRPGPGEKNGKAGVRGGPAIEVLAVPVETPGKVRVLPEPRGVREVREGEPQLLVRRIGLPEAMVPAKIGEPGVAHPRPGGDQQRRGID
jgi:hypothetical protein